MFGLMIGFGLFLLAATTATILQIHVKYSYDKNPLIFVSLFLVCIGGACWFINYIPPLYLLASIGCIASLYVLSISLLAKFWNPMQCLYGAKTVPNAYQGIVKPKFLGQVVKVSEIALQDMSAWLIVGGLITSTQSFFYTGILFTGIVFVLHVPGLWMFGRVYGTYFSALVTAVAFMVPLLYQIDELGFIYLYTMHLSGYIVMYFFMGLLGVHHQSQTSRHH